jgi:hypothetical protein
MSNVRSVVQSLLFVVASVTAPISAHALDFTYAITSVAARSTVSGTVTGTIYGLKDNATGAASKVTIDTFPAALNNIFGAAPIDTTAWNLLTENTFTVLSGQVVAAKYIAKQYNAASQQAGQLFINGGSINANFANIDGQDLLYVWGADGLAAANINPAHGAGVGPSPIPEPETYALMLVGLAAVGTTVRRRKSA